VSNSRVHDSVKSVVPRFPQPVAVLRCVRPFEIPSAVFLYEGGDHFDLFLHSGRGAMKLECEGVLDLQCHVGIAIDGLDQTAVHQLHSRDWYAELNHLDRGGDSLFDALKRAERGGDGFRNAI
jgi:hypothetical protein